MEIWWSGRNSSRVQETPRVIIPFPVIKLFRISTFYIDQVLDDHTQALAALNGAIFLHQLKYQEIECFHSVKRPEIRIMDFRIYIT